MGLRDTLLYEARRLARRGADAAMENPAVRRRVESARADFEDLRREFEERFAEVESDLWAWITQLQQEATRQQRQVARARDANSHYRTLGLRPGASLDEVKAAWRAKMRDHHPDNFADDPEAERAAHEKAQEINLAYQELRALLTGVENRRRD